MPTLTDDNKHFASDANKKVGAWHPNGEFNIEWLETTSANIKPGMAVTRATGAAGEKYCTEAGNDTSLAYGIAEFDPTQIADCDTAYASGDLIPVIPFAYNQGAICRNVVLADPGAAVNADDPLCCEASGQFGVATEATLIDEDGNGITSAFNDAGGPTVAGTNGANGATIHNRVYMKNQYYFADPGADADIVARIGIV